MATRNCSGLELIRKRIAMENLLEVLSVDPKAWQPSNRFHNCILTTSSTLITRQMRTVLPAGIEEDRVKEHCLIFAGSGIRILQCKLFLSIIKHHSKDQ
jgi:hypothetical protein